MIHKNFQACYLQFHLYKMTRKIHHMMTRKIYHVMLSHYLQIFQYKKQSTIEQIYFDRKLTPICSKLIFRRSLIKLATECTFKFNIRFFKQVYACATGGPLSVTFRDIYTVKIEKNVTPSKPIFYRRLVDDMYSRPKLGDNVLLDRLNNYRSNIKLTIEVNPSKILDTKLTNINGACKFNVHWKNTKLPPPWSSKTPKRYKRNTINGDLHLSKRILSNFDKEIPLIKDKFMKADYPLRFINSVVNEFEKGKECEDESFIIAKFQNLSYSLKYPTVN